MSAWPELKRRRGRHVENLSRHKAGRNRNTAVSRADLAAIQAGDWIQFAWVRNPSPSQTHSVMVVRTEEPRRPGYITVFTIGQHENLRGGGNYKRFDVSWSTRRLPYVYAILTWERPLHPPRKPHP